jgi:xanthine dehydrogenase accessory factor
MRDLIDQIEAMRRKQGGLALATVVQTWGSAPRHVGAKMAISSDGHIEGSVSGGCVEGAVAEEALGALDTQLGKLLHFGVADETAWGVGLACGGTIEVFVEPLDPAHYAVTAGAIRADQPSVTATVVDGPQGVVGQKASLSERPPAEVPPQDPALAQPLLDLARRGLSSNQTFRTQLPDPAGSATPLDVFVDLTPAPPELVIVGGVHIAVALDGLAHQLGYRTVVIDPRRSFGSRERFPDADVLATEWPEEAFKKLSLTPSTAVAVLTHDPKIDDKALVLALASRAGYIGALGSRTTQAKRRQRLADAGVTEAQLARLHGPVGLDIGAQTPEEIALSIMAEIVAASHQPFGAEAP